MEPRSESRDPIPAQDQERGFVREPSPSPGKEVKKPKKKAAKKPVDEFEEALRSFRPYEDGSIFVVMRYLAEVSERLREADHNTFKEHLRELGKLMRDPAVVPSENVDKVEGIKMQIFDLLRPYGEDLLEGWKDFEKSSASVAQNGARFE